jgi:2-oxoglutarate ferredoxin oxidoreductase subunit alpha
MSMSSVPTHRGAPAATPTSSRTHALVIALVGSGGDGVALLGDLLLQMAAAQGLYGVMVQSYGPQIRGGESAAVLRIATREIQYEGDATDLLVCFRASDLARFRGVVELHAGSTLVLDAADTGALPEWLGHEGAREYRFPFTRIEDGVEVPGDPRNMLALAMLTRVLGWPLELARHAVRERFGRRAEIVERNLQALDHGWAAADVPTLAPFAEGEAERFIETGNEAMARGAIEAGLRFFAGYPITPSSEIMETLVDELPAVGGRVVQAEDEIAALGMVIGASFGGVPAMTATSGPGLSLMTEMLGLSSMTEVPAVVIDCQRAGPATGMPSRTEQSDLFHAVYGGHGDFPRVVLGTFDVVHAREVMHRALRLSETWQLPVLVLSDAYIAQRRQIRDVPPAVDPSTRATRREWTQADGPARFDLDTARGVNPFRVPGTPGGTYQAAGIEHTAEGNPTSDTALHHEMNRKRFRKLEAIAEETAGWVRVLGRPDAPYGIVSWGSQYGLLREWVETHPEYRVFMPEIIHPFPLAAFEAWRAGLERCAVLELSFQGQFHRYLASLTDMRGVTSIARSGGAPLKTNELASLLAEEAST